jgi:hypothetical protein
MPIEAWLVTVGPGRHGVAELQRLWATAQSLWDRTVGALIQQNVCFECALYQANHVRYFDALHRVQKAIELPNGRKVRQSKDKAVLGPVAMELLALIAMGSVPLLLATTKSVREIDDVLRVLYSHVPPEWLSLDEIWTQVFKLTRGNLPLRRA